MIVENFYLSDDSNLNRAKRVTDLSLDEIEHLVGRFAKHSIRSGKLRGEVIIYVDGQVEIRHHFTKKTIWKSNE